MAILLGTYNGNTASNASGTNQHYVRARLYLDSNTGSGYKMHWVWDVYLIKWTAGTEHAFTYIYGETFTTFNQAYSSVSNVAIQTKTGGSFTVAYGSSCSTTAQAWYTEGETARNSTLSVSYTVPYPTYTISYNANGGTGAPASQSKTYDTVLTLSSVQPTRSSYDFQGWATSSTATEPNSTYAPGTTYSTNASLTLFAVWAPSQSNSEITSFTINRCLSDGTDNDQGDYCKITIGYLADTSTWNLDNNQISRLKVIIGDIETRTETINAVSGTISIKSNNIISKELNHKIIVSIVDTYMDQNNEDFLKYSDQKIKMLYGSKSLFRPKMYLKTWLKLDPALNRNDSLIAFPNNETDGLGPDKLYGIVEMENESGHSNNYILNLQSDNMSCSYSFDSTNITTNYMQDSNLMFIMGNDPITEIINVYQADDSNGTNETLIDILKYPPQITGANYIEDGLHVFYAIIDLSQGPYSNDKYYRFTYNVGNMLSSEHFIYADISKNFGIHLYSAGDWNENDNPPEGYLSAHIMDITHSMFKNMFFTVPDKYVINKLHRLCTQKFGLITNNVTNFVNENNKTVIQWNLNANYKVQEWPGGDTDPYNQTYYWLNLDEEEISNEEET